MTRAPLHPDEAGRLAALGRLGILDTPVDERFDRITRLLSTLLDTPISLVSLVDRDRQWFKSSVGLEVRETTRDLAFCAHAVADPDLESLVVPDATADPRFSDNPLVIEDPSIRFYAGHVLHDPTGYPVGTLCAIDTRPRELDARQRQILADLAAMVEAELARQDEIELMVRLDVSERATTTLLDSLDEGLVLFDTAGLATRWNTRAEQILGVDSVGMSGLSLDEERFRPVHADGSPWSLEDIPPAVALRTGTAVEEQTIGVMISGSRRWLRLRCRPVLDDEGRVEALVAAFRDITAELEERATSAALTERLRVAIAGSPLGTALADELGRFTYLNGAYASLLGDEPDAIVGRGSLDFVHPDDADRAAAEAASVAAGERDTLVTDLRVVDTAGRIKHVRSHATRLDPATTAAAYLIQVEDVTHEHQLTDALRRSEEFARTALGALDEGVVLADATGQVQLMNAAAERILVADADELTRQFRSPDATTTTEAGDPIPAEDRAVTRVLRTGQAARGEVLGWLRGDGTRLLLRLSAAPITLDDGSTGVVIAFRDISAQRALELELERFGILFQHANDIITVIDADGHVRYTSPSATRVLGYGELWNHASGVLGLVHPQDLAQARSELVGTVAGADTGSAFTVRVRDASGAWRWMETVTVNLLHEPAVRGVVLTSRDVTERQELMDELAHRASHDLLTELPNRSVVAEQLAAGLARARRSGGHVALCALDLDGFKAVNDTLGHAAGDRVLVNVADRIRSVVRAGDTPARIGGDEFVVILDPVRGIDEADQVAERIREAVLGDDDLEIDGVRCGVSVGVALSRPDDTCDTLSARADVALYASKAARDGSVGLVAG